MTLKKWCVMGKILIVEDDNQVRENLSELLESAGYDCYQAENGISALNLLHDIKPGLIISDIMMPGLNGFEFYDRVKSLILDNSIPFIFLTAVMDDLTREKSMELGAEGFITKPYNSKELLKIVKVRFEKKERIDQKFNELKMNISLYVPHELKTPLIPILGFSQMLIDDIDGFSETKVLEMLVAINRGGHRLKERMEKFSIYSELKINEYDDEEKITETFNPIESEIRYKIKESFHCAERYNDIEFNLDKCELLMCKKHFELLLFELTENACKYSPSGTKIKVSWNSKNDSYSLHVTSNGDEIDSSVMEDFYQVNKKYSQQIGNGLGLTIVKLIAKKYNLQISVTRDSQNANIISVFFPRALIINKMVICEEKN